MTGTFIAEKQVTINASAAAVWRALTEPELVKQYMHGTNMQTTWEIGSPITWKGEWQGKDLRRQGHGPGIRTAEVAADDALESHGWQRGQARELPHGDL